jgi:D-alanyl-D-alanine carboxypeptidase
MPADAALSKATAERLQAALERLVGSSATKGAAAAIVTPDGTWTGVTGVDGAGAPIEPDSAFGIGSVSKTVTAAEILHLASQGKLDLDTPVEEVVTLPFDAQGATIRQLATMQAGLPRPYGISADLETEVADDLGRTWTIGDVLEWVKDLPRLGTVGGPSTYNGTNYQVLSQVIEKVTGKPLATAFRDDLLGPAGLDRMWTQVGEQPQAPLAIAVDPGTGIVDAKRGFLPSKAAASTGNGAAGIAADAPTLARWAYLLYGGRVIDPAVLAPMMTPNWKSEWAYGFGSMFDKKATGTLAVGHAGDYMGYSAVMMGWPSTQTAVAILVPRQGMANNLTVEGWAFELYKVLEAGG